jgi:diguanylate cyclase (GGDEF)-like protein
MRNLLASPERIFFKDRESRFLFVSAGWLAAYCPGGSLAQVVGKTDFDVFSKPHATAAFEDERGIVATGRPVVAKVERETFHGRTDSWMSTTKLPLHGDSGEIIGTFGLSRDVTGQVEAQEALTHQAMHDSVTGLANRVALMERLVTALAQPARGREWIAVLFLDLDDFKSVNDTLGHRTGDQALREIGHRLTRLSRRGDTVARIGGDEFVLLCTALRGRGDLDLICNRVLKAIGAPLKAGPHDLTMTGSIGAVLSSQDEGDPDDLLQQADIAMYAAKRSGGNRSQIYAPGLRDLAESRRGMATELRQAIARSELFVLYQPVFDLQDASMLGAEALVRWRHPQRGVIGPLEFIPVAEQRGLITEIGDFVLNEACRQLSVWTTCERIPERLTIGVNLSGRELRDPKLAQRVATTLERHGVRPERLILEITENVLISELGDAHRAIESLTALGVRVALDDFGTGYSTLAHLRQLQADILKIDRSFVSQIVGHSRDREIVAAIIAMAHALRITVVAEGVETEAQRDDLTAMGCDAAQGYLFAKPLRAHALAALWPPTGIPRATAAL